jgi:hypothetical protein
MGGLAPDGSTVSDQFETTVPDPPRGRVGHGKVYLSNRMTVLWLRAGHACDCKPPVRAAANGYAGRHSTRCAFRNRPIGVQHPGRYASERRLEPGRIGDRPADIVGRGAGHFRDHGADQATSQGLGRCQGFTAVPQTLQHFSSYRRCQARPLSAARRSRTASRM